MCFSIKSIECIPQGHYIRNKIYYLLGNNDIWKCMMIWTTIDCDVIVQYMMPLLVLLPRYQCCCGIAAILQRKHNKKILNRMIDECIFHSSVGFDTCEQDKNLSQALQHSITFPTAEKMRRGKREKHTHTRTRTHGHIHGFHTHINRCIFNNAISNQKREKKYCIIPSNKAQKMEQRPRWLNALHSWSILGMKY